MKTKTIVAGPQPADILIVGDTLSHRDEKAQLPFQGTAGHELSSMLHDAGIVQSSCRQINLLSIRPPNDDISFFFPKRTSLRGGEVLFQDRYCAPPIQEGLMNLQKEITLTKPKVIIALGDTALWALTGESSISKWRGSHLEHKSGAWIIPTYHPTQIVKMWAWRFITTQDFRRAKTQVENPVLPPKTNFLIKPSFQEVQQTFTHFKKLLIKNTKPVRLSVDIETRAGHIDCVGIAWSETEAICIPLCTMTGGAYWTLEEEALILHEMKKILLHPSAYIIGQNFLYDSNYFAKHWGWYPTPSFDTMIAHAVAYPGLQKSLDFLASLYLPYHRYWKDESKEADLKVNDDQRWIYNCKDCCITWELQQPIQNAIEKENLQTPLNFEMSLFDPLMQMMMRGVRIDQKLRSEYSLSLLDYLAAYAQWFEDLGRGVWHSEELVKSKTASAWYKSPSQQKTIFYNLLGMEVVRDRKTKRPTVNDEALIRFAQKEPIMIPITEKLLTYRSLGVFYSTFVSANLDEDNRARTSYNPVGTETFRFSSSIDAFRKGMNLQNIPTGSED